LLQLSEGKAVDKEACEERIKSRYAVIKRRERKMREGIKRKWVTSWLASKHRGGHSLTMRTSQCFVNSSKSCHGEEHISVQLDRKHQ
jgi:hypothetical protein